MFRCAEFRLIGKYLKAWKKNTIYYFLQRMWGNNSHLAINNDCYMPKWSVIYYKHKSIHFMITTDNVLERTFFGTILWNYINEPCNTLLWLPTLFVCTFRLSDVYAAFICLLPAQFLLTTCMLHLVPACYRHVVFAPLILLARSCDMLYRTPIC